MPKDVNPRHGGKGGKEMGMCAPTRQLGAWWCMVAERRLMEARSGQLLR